MGQVPCMTSLGLKGEGGVLFKIRTPYCLVNKRNTNRKPTSFKGPRLLENLLALQWMDEILHHFETMRSHCLLVLTGEVIIPGFLSSICVPYRKHRQREVSHKHVFLFEFLSGLAKSPGCLPRFALPKNQGKAPSPGTQHQPLGKQKGRSWDLSVPFPEPHTQTCKRPGPCRRQIIPLVFP